MRDGIDIESVGKEITPQFGVYMIFLYFKN